MIDKTTIIKQIAEELDVGLDCYFNVKTTEIIAVPNFEGAFDEFELGDAFAERFDKIEAQEDDLIKFEALDSNESFAIMERFTAQLPDKNLRTKLEHVLANKKPFRHFKQTIDCSAFRQNWFDFKQQAIEKIVIELMEEQLTD